MYVYHMQYVCNRTTEVTHELLHILCIIDFALQDYNVCCVVCWLSMSPHNQHTESIPPSTLLLLLLLQCYHASNYYYWAGTLGIFHHQRQVGPRQHKLLADDDVHMGFT